MQQASSGVRGVDLAHSPSFRLGEIVVQPALRTARHGDRSVTLEPRVMQVLVALARARGGILSRDDLLMACWGGRVVGDNAIARAISQLRRLGPELGAEELRIESVARVGYRLVSDHVIEFSDTAPGGAAEAPDLPPSAGGVDGPSARGRLSRRGLMLGAAGAAAAGLGGGAWWFWQRPGRHRPHPEALALYERAIPAQRQVNLELMRQAASFLEQATQIDPLFADAWGALALAYADLVESFGDGRRQGLRQQAEAAARRGLELDPDNADAQAARIILQAWFRDWLRIEDRLTRLAARHPDNWTIQGLMSGIRASVGRYRDSLRHIERQIELDPYAPGPHRARALALWASGRLREAETAVDRGLARWPGNAQFFILKFDMLLYSGRPAQAAAFAADPEREPENMRPTGVSSRVTLARAGEHRRPSDIASTIADLRSMDRAGVDNAMITAQRYLHVGYRDDAIGALERYYFGSAGTPRLPAAPPPGPGDERYTPFLFLPGMRPLWGDPWFASLLRRIGLEDYWARSGSRPDYRSFA